MTDAFEEWRAVVGFDGLYEVSSAGRVRSLDRPVRSPNGMHQHRGRVIKPVLDKDGYPRVMLRVDGKHHTRRVHRLVCEAFNGPSNVLHCNVDHIDGDRANASAENLRWVSHAENHYHRRGTRSSVKMMLASLTEEQVNQVKATPISRGVPSRLAREFGVPRHVIYDILRGRTWRAPSSQSSLSRP